MIVQDFAFKTLCFKELVCLGKASRELLIKIPCCPFSWGWRKSLCFFLQKFIPIYFDRIRNHGGPGLVWLQCQIVSWSQFPKGWDDSVGKASVKRLVEGISQWKARPHSRQIHHAENEASILILTPDRSLKKIPSSTGLVLLVNFPSAGSILTNDPWTDRGDPCTSTQWGSIFINLNNNI